MDAELDAELELLQGQWRQLLGWLAGNDVLRHGDRPSGLGTWSVRELVAHLGYGIAMVTEVESLGDDAETTTLGRYVTGYEPAADVIAEQTRRFSADAGPDMLRAIDAEAAAAFAQVRRWPTRVVQGRRGALTTSDYLRTRLLELVVHGDDLARAVPEATDGSPLLGQAVHEVSDVLVVAYRQRTGSVPDGSDALDWIRRASGRVADPDPHLPLLG
jgi:uncharacterized protein (TIGR03083 family)